MLVSSPAGACKTPRACLSFGWLVVVTPLALNICHVMSVAWHFIRCASGVVFEQKPIPAELMETIARICVVMNRDFQVWCLRRACPFSDVGVSRVVCLYPVWTKSSVGVVTAFDCQNVYLVRYQERVSDAYLRAHYVHQTK